MKKILYTILFIALFLPAGAQDSGIRFYHGTWDEAIALAKKEKKKVFVDFFTEWCGPCLTMALEVFPLPQVGEVYNNNFVCLKVDAEKGEGRELARRYAVNSYPTYVFVDPKTQELVHRSGGNKPVKDFLADAKGAMNPHLSSIYLEKKFKDGKYDAAFLKDYILQKKASGNRDLEKLFDELAEKGGGLANAEVWEVFCECINGYKNAYIQQVLDDYARFVELYGQKAVDAKLASATMYAPASYLKGLRDFDGKDYNFKIAQLSALFREEKTDEAYALIDRLAVDTTIDQKQFVKWLSFYVRVSPKRGDEELPFDALVKKVRYARYVAYNMYDRDDAANHFNYAVALEYLIQRSQLEGRQIPADVLATPPYGKQEYNMRHPLLKAKPQRK